MNHIDDPISPANAATTLREMLGPTFEAYPGWKNGRGNTWFSLTTKLFKAEFYGRVPSWSFELALSLRPKYPAQMKAAVSPAALFDLEIDLARLAETHNLPLSLTGVLPGGENQYTMLVNCGRAVESTVAELAAVLEHALQLLQGIDSWQSLDHWTNRVGNAQCPFRYLRRPETWTPMNHYADLAVAKAASAPDFTALASEKLLRYRERDVPFVGNLEAFISGCEAPVTP